MTIQNAIIAAAIGCTLLATSNLSAQANDSSAASRPESRWGLMLNSGTLVPTGAQRDVIKRGSVSAAQLTYALTPAFAITSTAGWARSKDVSIADDPKLDVFTYDVGVEFRAPRWTMGKSVTFAPFAGAGAGGRSYNYRKLDVDATHNAAAYGSIGGEIGVGRARVRLEARDYAAGFKPLLAGGPARTSNDVVVMAGLRFASR